MAFPSDRVGITSTMMARLFACSIAAPTAWSARNPHSDANPGARPQSTEASDEDHEAVDVQRLAPHMSANRPTAVTVATSTSR